MDFGSEFYAEYHDDISSALNLPVFWVNCPLGPNYFFFKKTLISNMTISFRSEIDTEHDDHKQKALNPTHF